MATLLISTFPTDSEGTALLKKVKRALAHICGHGVSKKGIVLTAPKKLDANRDNLKSNYREIWKKCTIQYDGNESGASVLMKSYEIKLGPFFLRPSITVVDLEEVLLHEFLHVALAIEGKEFHHSLMTQILRYNLHYKDTGKFTD